MATATDTKKIAKLQAEFYEQLSAFLMIDESDYDSITPLQDKVLVRLFEFKPKSDAVGTSAIYVPNLEGKWVKSEEAKYQSIYPIVKIVRSDDEDYPVGKLFVVSRDEVVGEDWNPEFLHLVNTYQQQGNKGGMIKAPEEMRQKIPRLEKNWARYHFGCVDQVAQQEESDDYIFLIPKLKMIAQYEYSI